jgi:enoyl-CoA hydratase/carnithine racemase
LADLSKLEVVVYERIGAVALMRMNRPERLNALSAEMHRDLIACYDEINENPEIKAGVVTSTGRFFCAGRDIKEFIETYESGKLRPLDDPDHPLFGMSAPNYETRKPLIGALQGPAFGGGLSLTLSFDMIVMADDAWIADGHAKVNIGALTCLFNYIPPMIACEIAMNDRKLTAEECLRYGLANRVVPRDEVVPTAVAMAQNIATMGTEAIRSVKDASIALKRSGGQILDGERREERRRNALAAREQYKKNPDLLEGMKAFLDKRDPQYVNTL